MTGQNTGPSFLGWESRLTRTVMHGHEMKGTPKMVNFAQHGLALAAKLSEESTRTLTAWDGVPI